MRTDPAAGRERGVSVSGNISNGPWRICSRDVSLVAKVARTRSCLRQVAKSWLNKLLLISQDTFGNRTSASAERLRFSASSSEVALVGSVI